jgi:hypothetical protein
MHGRAHSMFSAFSVADDYIIDFTSRNRDLTNEYQ